MFEIIISSLPTKQTARLNIIRFTKGTFCEYPRILREVHIYFRHNPQLISIFVYRFINSNFFFFLIYGVSIDGMKITRSFAQNGQTWNPNKIQKPIQIDKYSVGAIEYKPCHAYIPFASFPVVSKLRKEDVVFMFYDDGWIKDVLVLVDV